MQTRPTKALTKSEEVSLAQVLAKLVDRDAEHHAAWAQLTAKQQDLGRLLEAVLVEQTRMGRAMEAQAGYNERQIKLAEQTQAHSETFARAFNDIREIREENRIGRKDLERLIDSINEAFTGYREQHQATHQGENTIALGATARLKEDVDQFKGSIRTGIVVAGLVGLLIGVVVNTWRSDYDAKIAKVQSTVESNTATITSLRIDMIRPALEQKK